MRSREASSAATAAHHAGRLRQWWLDRSVRAEPTALAPALAGQKATMDLLRRQVADLARGPAALVKAQRADRLGEGRPLEAVDRSADDLGRLTDSLARSGELIAGRAARRDRPRLALLAAIVDASDDAIVSSNVDGLISSWNPAAERSYGYPAAEAVGQDSSFVIEPDLRGEESEMLSGFVASQSSNGSNDSNRSLHARRVLAALERGRARAWPVIGLRGDIHEW